MSFIPVDSDDDEYQISSRRYGSMVAEDDDEELGVYIAGQSSSSSDSSSSDLSSDSDSNSDDSSSDSDSSDSDDEDVLKPQIKKNITSQSSTDDTSLDTNGINQDIKRKSSKNDKKNHKKRNLITISSLFTLFPSLSTPQLDSLNTDTDRLINLDLSHLVQALSIGRGLILDQRESSTTTNENITTTLNNLRTFLKAKINTQQTVFSTSPFSSNTTITTTHKDEFYSFQWELYLLELTIFSKISTLEQFFEQNNFKSDLISSKNTSSSDTTSMSIEMDTSKSTTHDILPFLKQCQEKILTLLDYIGNETNHTQHHTKLLLSSQIDSFQSLSLKIEEYNKNSSFCNNDDYKDMMIQSYQHINNLIQSLKRLQSIKCLLIIFALIGNSHLIPLELQIPITKVLILSDFVCVQMKKEQEEEILDNNNPPKTDEELDELASNFVIQFIQRPQILPIILSTPQQTTNEIYSTQPLITSPHPLIFPSLNNTDPTPPPSSTSSSSEQQNESISIDLVELIINHFMMFYREVYGISAQSQGYSHDKLQDLILFNASFQPLLINLQSHLDKTHHFSSLTQYNSQLNRSKVGKESKNDKNDKDGAKLQNKMDALTFKLSQLKSTLSKPRFDGGFIEAVKITTIDQCKEVREYYFAIKMRHWNEVCVKSNEQHTPLPPSILQSSNQFNTLIFLYDGTLPYRYTTPVVIAKGSDKIQHKQYKNYNQDDSSVTFSKDNTTIQHSNQLLSRYQHGIKLINDLSIHAVTATQKIMSLEEFQNNEKVNDRKKRKSNNQDDTLQNNDSLDNMKKPIIPMVKTVLLTSKPIICVGDDQQASHNNQNGVRNGEIDVLYTNHVYLFSTPKDDNNFLKYYPRNSWLLNDLMDHSLNYTRNGNNKNDNAITNNDNRSTRSLPELKFTPEFTLLHSLFDVSMYKNLLQNYKNDQHVHTSPQTATTTTTTPLDISINPSLGCMTSSFETILSTFFQPIQGTNNSTETSLPSGENVLLPSKSPESFHQLQFPEYETCDGFVTTPLHMLQLYNPILSFNLINPLFNQLKRVNLNAIIAKNKENTDLMSDGVEPVKKNQKKKKNDKNDTRNVKLSYETQHLMYRILTTIQNTSFCDRLVGLHERFLQSITGFVTKGDIESINVDTKQTILTYLTTMSSQYRQTNLKTIGNHDKNDKNKDYLIENMVDNSKKHVSTLKLSQPAAILSSFFPSLSSSTAYKLPSKLQNDLVGAIVDVFIDRAFAGGCKSTCNVIDSLIKSSKSTNLFDFYNNISSMKMDYMVNNDIIPLFKTISGQVFPTNNQNDSNIVQDQPKSITSSSINSLSHLSLLISHVLDLYYIDNAPSNQLGQVQHDVIKTFTQVSAVLSHFLPFFIQQLMILTQHHITTLQSNPTEYHLHQQNLYVLMLLVDIVNKMLIGTDSNHFKMMIEQPTENTNNNHKIHLIKSTNSSTLSQSAHLQTYFSAQLSYTIDLILMATVLPDIDAITQDEINSLYNNNSSTSLSSTLITTLHYWRSVTVNFKNSFSDGTGNSQMKCFSQKQQPLSLLLSLNSSIFLLFFYYVFNINQNNVLSLFLQPGFNTTTSESSSIMGFIEVGKNNSIPNITQDENVQNDPSSISTGDGSINSPLELTVYCQFDHNSTPNNMINELYQHYKNDNQVVNRELFSTLPPTPTPISISTPSLITTPSNSVILNDNNWIMSFIKMLGSNYSTFYTLCGDDNLEIFHNQSSSTSSNHHSLSHGAIITHSIALGQHAVVMALSQVYLGVSRDAITTVLKGPQNVKQWSNTIPVSNRHKDHSNDNDLDVPSEETYQEALGYVYSDIQSTFTVPRGLITNSAIILALLRGDIDSTYQKNGSSLSKTTGTTDSTMGDGDNGVQVVKATPILVDLETFDDIFSFANSYIGIFAMLPLNLNLPQRFINQNNFGSMKNGSKAKKNTQKEIIFNNMIQFSLLSTIPNIFIPKPQEDINTTITDESTTTTSMGDDGQDNTDIKGNKQYSSTKIVKMSSYLDSLSHYLEYQSTLTPEWTDTYLISPLKDYIGYVESSPLYCVGTNVSNPSTNFTSFSTSITETTPHRFILSLVQQIIELTSPSAALYTSLNSTTLSSSSPQSLKTINQDVFPSKQLDVGEIGMIVGNNGPILENYTLSLPSSHTISSLISSTIRSLNPLTISLTAELNNNIKITLLPEGDNDEKAKNGNVVPIPGEFITQTEKYTQLYTKSSTVLQVLHSLDLIESFNVKKRQDKDDSKDNVGENDSEKKEGEETIPLKINHKTTPLFHLLTYAYHQLQDILPTLASYTNLYTTPCMSIRSDKAFPSTWKNQIDLYLLTVERREQLRAQSRHHRHDQVDRFGRTHQERVIHAIKRNIEHIEGLFGLQSTLSFDEKGNNRESNDSNNTNTTQNDQNNPNATGDTVEKPQPQHQQPQKMSFKFRMKLKTQLAILYDDLAKLDPTYSAHKRNIEDVIDDSNQGNHQNANLLIDVNHPLKHPRGNDDTLNMNGVNPQQSLLQPNQDQKQFHQTKDSQQQQQPQPFKRFDDSHLVQINYLPQFTQEHLTEIINHQQNTNSQPSNDKNEFVSLGGPVSNEGNVPNDEPTDENLLTPQQKIFNYCTQVISTTLSQYGPVHSVILPLNPITQLPKGSCKVIFVEEKDAKVALEAKKLKLRFEYDPVKVSTTIKFEPYVSKFDNTAVITKDNQDTHDNSGRYNNNNDHRNNNPRFHNDRKYNRDNQRNDGSDGKRYNRDWKPDNRQTSMGDSEDMNNQRNGRYGNNRSHDSQSRYNNNRDQHDDQNHRGGNNRYNDNNNHPRHGNPNQRDNGRYNNTHRNNNHKNNNNNDNNDDDDHHHHHKTHHHHQNDNKKNDGNDDGDDYYSMMLKKKQQIQPNNNDTATTSMQDGGVSGQQLTQISEATQPTKPKEKTAEEKRRARNAILGIRD